MAHGSYPIAHGFPCRPIEHLTKSTRLFRRLTITLVILDVSASTNTHDAILVAVSWHPYFLAESWAIRTLQGSVYLRDLLQLLSYSNHHRCRRRRCFCCCCSSYLDIPSLSLYNLTSSSSLILTTVSTDIVDRCCVYTVRNGLFFAFFHESYHLTSFVLA